MTPRLRWMVAFVLVGAGFWCGDGGCQEPSHCARVAQAAREEIKKLGEITPPQVIRHQKVNLANMKTPIGPLVDRISFIVLIDERGLVECADYQDGADGNQDLIDRCEEAIRGWQFEIPRDANGKVFACFDLVVIRVRK